MEFNPLLDLLNTGFIIIEIGLFYGGGERLGAKICRFLTLFDKITSFWSVLNRGWRTSPGGTWGAGWGPVAPPLFCRATKTKIVNYLYLLKKGSISPPLKISFRRACDLWKHLKNWLSSSNVLLKHWTYFAKDMLINSKTRYLLHFFYDLISVSDKFQWKLRSIATRSWKLSSSR